MNEPVAWMLTLPDGTHDWILDGNGCEGYIPLYTHPVKEQDESFDRTASHMAGEYVSYTKELTDEEIQEVAHGFGAIGWMGDTTYEFARAILRKAQEK
jgi:hypothetical protein